jgi:hypothetical protein
MNRFTHQNMNACRQQAEDPLNLQSLPLVDPPDDAWPAIEAALLRRDSRQKRARRVGGALAAVATVTLAVGLFFEGPLRSPAPEVQPATNPGAATLARTEGRAVDATTEPTADSQLSSLITLSQQLEERLRTMRQQVGDMPSGALVYQVELEDLVVQVDDALSINPDSMPLWSQRVDLLADLNMLYEDRLRREYRQVASL